MLTRLLAIVIASGGLVACSDGVQPDQREIVYFTALETDELAPEVLPDPGPSVSKAQSKAYDPIVNGFIENHDRLLRRDDIKTQIARIEQVFTALGKFHQLVAIYRKDFDEYGTDSKVADRLAWAYIRLGQRQAARDVLDALQRDEPQDPMTHFLEGALYIQREQRTVDHMRRVVAAWSHVVELDPNFKGFEGLTADVLQAEVAKLEQQLERVDPGGSPDAAVRSAGDLVNRALAMAPKKPVPEVAPQTQEPAESEQVEPPPNPTASTTEEEEDGEVAEEEQVAEGEQEEEEKPERVGPRPRAQRYRLLVARGEIALSQGKYEQAKQSFLQARALEPTGFEAEFGHLQARWGDTEARNDVAAKMRALAERDNLTAKQQIDLGTFLWTKTGRKDMAKALFEKAADDPKVGARAKSLLDQMMK